MQNTFPFLCHLRCIISYSHHILISYCFMQSSDIRILNMFSIQRSMLTCMKFKHMLCWLNFVWMRNSQNEFCAQNKQQKSVANLFHSAFNTRILCISFFLCQIERIPFECFHCSFSLFRLLFTHSIFNWWLTTFRIYMHSIFQSKQHIFSG